MQLKGIPDHDFIAFSVNKGGLPPDGDLVLREGDSPNIDYEEEGDVEVQVVVEAGEPTGPGFMAPIVSGPAREPEAVPDEEHISSLSFSYSQPYSWAITRRGSPVFSSGSTWRHRFSVAAGDRVSFGLVPTPGVDRSQFRAVMSYSFFRRLPAFTPGQGGSVTGSVSNLSSSIVNGIRTLSVSVALGVFYTVERLNYKWQYAEQGSNDWTDLDPESPGFIGASTPNLRLTREYDGQNLGRRHRVVVTSSYFSMSPITSQEVPPPAATLPGRTAILSVTPGATSASLSWQAFNGYSAITNYVVQYAVRPTSGLPAWTTVDRSPSAATSAEVTGLAEGEQYVFRVAAVNAVGQGPYSLATPNIPPAAPTSLAGSSLELEIGGNQAFINLVWSAPPDNGGSPVTSYSLQYSTNYAEQSSSSSTQKSSSSSEGGANWTSTGGAISTTTRRFWVPFSGATYRFRVAAVNSAGQGAWSSTHEVEVPAGTTPGLPRNMTTSPMLRSVRLFWDQPLSLGNDYPNGFLLLEYKVEYSSDGGATWTEYQAFQNVRDRLFGGEGNVLGLEPAVGYRFRVSACNEIGCGAYTTTPAATQPFYGPDAPANVRALRYTAASPSGNYLILAANRYFVDWTAPSTDMAIQTYDVQMKEAGSFFNVSDPGVSATRLYNIAPQQQTDEILASGGLSRLFRVRANTGGGFGPWNDPPVTFSDAAGLSPTAQNHSISNAQPSPPSRTITISWTPPAASVAGFTLQRYEAFLTEYNSLNAPIGSTTVTASSSATSLSFSDTSGRRRGFSVLAVYTNGVKTMGINSVSTNIPAMS